MEKVLSLLWLSLVSVSCLRSTILYDGVRVEDAVLCDDYAYFQFETHDPCQDVRFQVETTSGDADLYIGKYPNVPFPTLRDLTWTSYNWGNEDLILSHYDPDFSTGVFTIGVHAYCGTDNILSHAYTRFNITVSLQNGDGAMNTKISNQSFVPNAYVYNRFCVPLPATGMCQMIRVHFNQAATHSHLLISTKHERPSFDGLSWKLLDDNKTDIDILHTDLYYKPGHYYTAVYGECDDNASCSHLAMSSYSIEVNVTEHPCEKPDVDVPVYQQPLDNGQPFHGKTQCGAYSFYRVEVTDPCSDLRIVTNNIEGETTLYVANYPNKNPTPQHQMWTSLGKAEGSVVVSHLDYDFVVDTYYIGVHASCEEGVTMAIYNITAYLEPAMDNIVGIPVTDRPLTANGYTHHHFCVSDSKSDITITLVNNLSISLPEMLVSTEDNMPLLNSYAWKLAEEDRRTIFISHKDPDFKVGRYFVAIYGWCTPAGFCGVPDDQCPSSCLKVSADRYSLYVTTSQGTSGSSSGTSSATDSNELEDSEPDSENSWKNIAIAALIFGLISFLGMAALAAMLWIRFRAPQPNPLL